MSSAAKPTTPCSAAPVGQEGQRGQPVRDDLQDDVDDADRPDGPVPEPGDHVRDGEVGGQAGVEATPPAGGDRRRVHAVGQRQAERVEDGRADVGERHVAGAARGRAAGQAGLDPPPRQPEHRQPAEAAGRRRADDDDPVALEVDALQQLPEHRVGLLQGAGEARGALGSRQGQPVAVGPLEVRHLHQDGVAGIGAGPGGVEGVEHGGRVHAPAAGRGRVDDGEVPRDRAATDASLGIHHRQGGFAVQLVDTRGWTAVGVGDDRRGAARGLDGLSHGAGHGAVEQVVGVGAGVLDGQRQDGRGGGVVPGERPVDGGTGVGPDLLVGVHGVPGPAAVDPGPVAGPEGDVALADVGAGADGPHGQRRHRGLPEELHQVGRSLVDDVLPDQAGHRDDEHLPRGLGRRGGNPSGRGGTPARPPPVPARRAPRPRRPAGRRRQRGTAS